MEINPKYSNAYNSRGNAKNELNYNEEDIIADYDKAIEIDNNINAYYNKALYYNTNENYEKALNLYNKVLEIDEYYIEAYGNRAIVLYNLNKNKEAIKDCDKAIELDSEYWLLYFNRAEIKLEVAQKNIDNFKKLNDEAFEDINKSYELALEDEDNLNEFKDYVLELANKNFEAAIKFCKEHKLL
ncbi:tetratricopeptide repeat protein [Brachyspira pulli]|uniref:tetratricopeptide repeat protein n=1 Tax=Brachyspira pulli TaxID=310721 RepID=UPI003006769E